MNEQNQQQGQETPLGVYPISFEIYAHSPQEAEDARMAIIAFIGLHARQGRAITGEKIAKAVLPYLVGLIAVFLLIVFVPLIVPGLM